MNDALPIKIRGLSHPEIPLFDKVERDEWGWVTRGGTVTHQEKAYIASCWSKDERSNPAYFWVSKGAFHHQFNLNVVCFLVDARPDLFVLACNTERPDQILGWACVQHDIVHHCHIKKGFHEYEIENLLVGERPDATPFHFMELINDQRKAEAKADSVSRHENGSRKANSEHPAAHHGQTVS